LVAVRVSTRPSSGRWLANERQRYRERMRTEQVGQHRQELVRNLASSSVGRALGRPTDSRALSDNQTKTYTHRDREDKVESAMM
jgi:hypothetical protein